MNKEFTTDLKQVYDIENLTDSDLTSLYITLRELVDVCKDLRVNDAYQFYYLKFRSVCLEMDYRNL